MRRYVEFRIDIDEDGSAKLMAEFHTNGFSGQSGAYFSIDSLVTEIKKFAQYPILEDVHPNIQGGYWDKTGQKKVVQEHLYISLKPIGSRGNLGLTIRLAEPMDDWEKGLRYSASAEFNTNYEQVAQFTKDMISLIQGKTTKVLFEEID